MGSTEPSAIYFKISDSGGKVPGKNRDAPRMIEYAPRIAVPIMTIKSYSLFERKARKAPMKIPMVQNKISEA